MNGGKQAAKEVSMTTQTQTPVSPDSAPRQNGGNKPKASAVAQLLARFSKSAETYADYQMDKGVWRKLAI